jgi:hypothetical protein
MKTKILLFFLGVLILAQMQIYMQIREKNEKTWTKALNELTYRITNQKNEIISTEQAVLRMEKDKESIPQTILDGVKDPEGKFLEFMDYLDRSELSSLDGSYEISADPVIKSQPVPLQQTDFHIQFQFANAKKLESILGYLLEKQRDYPLKVNRLNITRVPGKKPKADLEVSLLLPAKILNSETNKDSGGESIGG